MELMSLLSFQDSNLDKRDLKADKKYYHLRSISRLLSSFGMTAIGASIIPDMINGDVWGAILRLLIALGALVGAIIMGAFNGVKGARLKLSTVEDVCGDLERWAGTKPKLPKYKEIKFLPVEEKPIEEPQAYEVAEKIFSLPIFSERQNMAECSESTGIIFAPLS